MNFNDDSGCQISKPGVQNSKQEQSTIKNWRKLEVFKNLYFFTPNFRILSLTQSFAFVSCLVKLFMSQFSEIGLYKRYICVQAIQKMRSCTMW